MKFTINREALLAELAFVKGATEQKQTIPALSYLLAEADTDGTARFTGTDLDVTALTSTTADVEGAGSACILARKLYDITRALPADEVTFESRDNDRVRVTSGRATFNLAGIPRDSFAQTPAGKTEAVTLPAEAFREVVEQTSYAISDDDASGWQQQGLKFTLNKSGLRAVSTDGHRLAMFDRPEFGASVNGVSVDVLIPRKALNLVASFLTSEKDELRIGADENHIYFEAGPRLLISRTLAGQFPNYEMVIPKSHNGRASFDASELASAVRRAQLVADSDSVGRSLEFHLKPGGVTVTAETRETGDAEETVGAEYEGEPRSFIFTGSYLLDILNSSAGRKVVMEFRDSLSQVAFKPDGMQKTDILVPRQR